MTGALLAPLGSKLPEKAKASAEAVRTVQVTAVKMLGTDCSAQPKAAR